MAKSCRTQDYAHLKTKYVWKKKDLSPVAGVEIGDTRSHRASKKMANFAILAVYTEPHLRIELTSVLNKSVKRKHLYYLPGDKSLEEWHKAQLVGFARPALGQCDCLGIVVVDTGAQRSLVSLGWLQTQSPGPHSLAARKSLGSSIVFQLR